MIFAKNCEKLSKFIEVTTKILFVSFLNTVYLETQFKFHYDKNKLYNSSNNNNNNNKKIYSAEHSKPARPSIVYNAFGHTDPQTDPRVQRDKV